MIGSAEGADEFAGPRHPGRRWYDVIDDDGPHVCPNCFCYLFTHPVAAWSTRPQTASLGSTPAQLVQADPQLGGHGHGPWSLLTAGSRCIGHVGGTAGENQVG